MEQKSAELLRQARECDSNLSIFAKLYAAHKTLAAAIRNGHVSAALLEICSNLLGCEQVAIVEIDSHTEELHFLAEEGLSPQDRGVLAENISVLQSQINSDDAVIFPGRSSESAGMGEFGVTALVPLWNDRRSSAALVLFKLLPQRDGFDEDDRTILKLLSIYAGPCLRRQDRD